MYIDVISCPATVKANGSTKDWSSTDGNCLAHAICAITVCNCVVQVRRHSILQISLNMVVVLMSCPVSVEAVGSTTDCARTDRNCPAHASATTVCNYDAGWIDDDTACTGKKTFYSSNKFKYGCIYHFVPGCSESRWLNKRLVQY